MWSSRRFDFPKRAASPRAKIKIWAILTAVLSTSLSFHALAENWLSNSRWAIDAASRWQTNLDTHSTQQMSVLGFDFHKVFSTASGDYGTLVFQPYFVAREGENELTWRIANFNYTGLANGKMNVRVGHFELPFGLEHNIDTNGTLQQLSFRDRGLKADWGVSLNGTLPQFDYEIAVTRGTGNTFRREDASHAYSARIGTPAHKNLVLGLSWLNGAMQAGEQLNKQKKWHWTSPITATSGA